MFPVEYFDEGYWVNGYWARGANTAREYLTARQLRSLRATTEASLVDYCEVWRRTVAVDGQGGETWTWSVQSGSRCRLRESTADEVEAEGTVTADSDWILLLPHLVDLGPEDRVRVDGVDYEITETDRPKTERLYRRCRLTRVV